MKKLIRIVNFISHVTIALLIFFTFISCETEHFKDPLTPQEREWLMEHDRQITLAVEMNYAPFAFVDENGNGKGLATDYIELIEEKLNFRLKKARFKSLDEILSQARQKEIDVVNAVTETPTRSEYLLFTKSFIEIPNVIIVRKDQSEPLTINKMKDMKISLVKNYAVTEYLIKNYNYLDVDLVPDDLTALLNVSFSKTNSAIIDLATASYFIEQKGITNLRIAGDAGYNIKLAIASRKDWPILNQILEKGLFSISDKERKAIKNKWISFGQMHLFESKEFWIFILTIFTIVLLSTAGIIIWNRALKRQIEKSTMQLQAELVERERAEKALRESEEKYRSMMKSMQAAVYICSPDFRVEYMNPASIKRAGRDATGEVCHKVIYDLDNRCPWCVHEKIQQGESLRVEIVSPKDHRFYDISHSPIYRPDGSISKMTISRDITVQKQAEEERVRLATAIEQASESIIIADSPGTIQYVNPAFERLSGYARQEIVRQNFRVLKSDRHDEAFYRKMYDIISKGEIWSGRITNRMKDGTLREFETRISPIKDNTGKIINYVSVNRDITQEVALEVQLQQAQKIQSIGTLAGGIAHDFNNILFPIIGFAEMTLEDLSEDSPFRDRVNQILIGAERARDLVKQILTFSRQTEKELKPLRIQQIIKEVLKLSRSTLPSTIEIIQDIDNNCGPVMADTTQIHQVVMNLITNAYHAMEESGGELEVTLKEIYLDRDELGDPSMVPGPYICLTVSDTGIGLEPHVLNRIFEPYFTTKEKDKGTGLGLSVVHGIVKSYGGDIWVYSELGKGTVFHIYLPVFKFQVESAETETVTVLPQGTERILLVDDEEQIVRMEKQMLEGLGYHVTARTSSIEALKAFTANPDKFDLVITDMTMPNMTGVQLSQKLLDIKPGIPIIVCTGFSEKINGLKAKSLGLSGFIMKPVAKSELAKRIKEVLDLEKK